MIFATDLDRTIIYSEKFINEENRDKVELIETLDEKPISYISKTALEELKNLSKQIYIIPVTTRSIKQYTRINTFEYCDYAITSNGGTIIYKGKILEEWENHINKLLEPYKQKMEEMIELLKKEKYITREPSLIDEKYIFTKTENVEECEKELEKKIDKNLWNFTIQGQKVYVIPKGITKSNALNYLKEKLKENIVIASGDGKMDKDMLDLADIPILPKHGELYSKLNYNKENLILVDNGVFSSDEIIKEVKKLNKGGKNNAI